MCVSHSWRAKHADAHIEGGADAHLEGGAGALIHTCTLKEELMNTSVKRLMHTLKEGLMHTSVKRLMHTLKEGAGIH